MGNKIEVVDGVKGEWRKVTKAEEVKVGQRVRYGGDKVGFAGQKRVVFSITEGVVMTYNGCSDFYCIDDLFKRCKKIQAFFPVAEKKPRKVAKVYAVYFRDRWRWVFESFKFVEIHSFYPYTTRAHAIRGARRFCKTIGFECEIVN